MALGPEEMENKSDLKRPVALILHRSWIVLLSLDVLALVWFALETKTEVLKPKTHWMYSMNNEDGQTYAQWNGPDSIKPFQQKRQRITPEEGEALQLPKMVMGQGKKRKSIMLSQFNQIRWDENSDVWLIYDDWTKIDLLKHPVLPLPAKIRERILLIDSSGTMSEPLGPDHEQSRYRLAMQKLWALRKVSPEPWRLYTFSDRILSHGSWDIESREVPFSSLPEARGRTSLLSSLGELNEILKTPSDIVIVTDGEIDQRDMSMVEEVFRHLRASGHRLNIMSPELKSVSQFEFAIQKGLLSKGWLLQEAPVVTKTTHAADEPGLKWNQVPETKGSAMVVPVLFSKDGLPLVYFNRTKKGNLFHVIGSFQGEMDVLQKHLQKLWQISPVVMVEREKIRVDFLNESLHPLRVKMASWQSVEPELPGVYTFASPIWKESINFYHPESGPFTVERLQWVAKWQRAEESKRIKVISLDAFWSPLSDGQWVLVWLLCILHFLIFTFTFGSFAFKNTMRYLA